MLNQKARRLAATGITMVPVTALMIMGASGGSAARAAAIHGHSRVPLSAITIAAARHADGCWGSAGQLFGPNARYCYFQTKNGSAPLYEPNNTLYISLPLNDEVEITCYYYDENGYVQDHVVWTQATGSFTGHIPDSYINEGGANPWQSPGLLPYCGQ